MILQQNNKFFSSEPIMKTLLYQIFYYHYQQLYF